MKADLLVNDLMKRYGEEGLDVEGVDLIKESFWSDLRSSLYKQIAVGAGGSYQWGFITGKKSHYSDGKRIHLSDESFKCLGHTVAYLQSEEGLSELMEHGIPYPPEHIDDLIDLITFAKTDREIKKDQFRLFLKHKNKIMQFLLR